MSIDRDCLTFVLLCFINRTIKPGQEAEQEIEVKATRHTRGNMLVAKCYSKQLGEIMGATLIHIE